MSFRSAIVLALLVMLGCRPAASSSEPNPTPSDSNSSGSCKGVGTSSLPGACISFATDSVTWSVAEAAAGVSVPYEVIIEQPIDDVIVTAQDAGGCEIAGPSGLAVFERLADDDHEYCLCDSGLCAPNESTPVTIPAGRTPARFEWTGREWFGPSDTDNPLGPAFVPGTYVLQVSARGTVDGQAFEVRNEITVVLTP